MTPSKCKDCNCEVTEVQEKLENRAQQEALEENKKELAEEWFRSGYPSICCDARVTDDGYCSECKEHVSDPRSESCSVDCTIIIEYPDRAPLDGDKISIKIIR